MYADVEKRIRDYFDWLRKDITEEDVESGTDEVWNILRAMHSYLDACQDFGMITAEEGRALYLEFFNWADDFEECYEEED